MESESGMDLEVSVEDLNGSSSDNKTPRDKSVPALNALSEEATLLELLQEKTSKAQELQWKLTNERKFESIKEHINATEVQIAKLQTENTAK